MTRRSRAGLVMVIALVAACAGSGDGPVALRRGDNCAFCRMAISDRRFAAQLIAPGEEPRLFDDIGCLGAYVKAAPALPQDARAFVTDFRTGAWIAVGDADLFRLTSVETPMNSHIAAVAREPHRSASVQLPGAAVAPSEIFGTRSLK